MRISKQSRSNMACSKSISLAFIVLISLLGSSMVVEAQYDGSFWWMNPHLLKRAEELREEKDVKAVVVNNQTEADSVRLSADSYTDTSDDSPDCICVPSDRCNTTVPGKQSRDGLCGTGNTCCRRSQIIQLPQQNVTPVQPPPRQPPGVSTPKPSTTGTTNHTHPSGSVIPDLSLLTEISSLLQEFNAHDLQLEPDAEFIFDVTPAPAMTTSSTTSRTVSTVPSTTPRPIAPKPKKCGQRRAAIASRIHFIDDDEEIEERLDGMANFGEFPWTVYVQERISNGSFAYKCGGALITSGAVITAGHCVANARNNPNSFQIIAGDWDRRHTRERLPSQTRQIDRIVLHPNYYSGSLYNDVAILIFNHPLNESTPNVANICLPSIGENFYGSNCLLSGWGATPRTPTQEEPIQRFVTMPLVSPRTCEAQLQQTNSLRGQRFRMHDSFQCAGGVKGRDLCKGSGGSPLVCEKGGAYMLVGIMSWGVSCAEGVPAVFASAVYQAGWIRGVIDELEDNVVYFV